MSRSIFIGCALEDLNRVETLKKWAAANRLGDYTINNQLKDYRAKGEKTVSKQIKARIKEASKVVLILGKNVESYEWMVALALVSKSLHKYVVCMKAPNISITAPKMLKRFGLINFDPDSLKKALQSESEEEANLKLKDKLEVQLPGS